jgi:RNA polymerase sigma factor (sigma-70 family)
MNDVALLAGDPEDFGAFYRRHESAMLAYYMRRTRRADLAADLTAETFARALAGRSSFDSRLGEPRGWLFGIARNVLADSVQRGQVEDETRRRLGMEPVVVDDDAIGRIEALSDDRALPVLAALPAEQRGAVTGRVIEERDYEELANELACSASVVRQRVSRGLRTLRARLEGDGS